METDGFYTTKNDRIIVRIKARPQSGQTSIAGIVNNEIIVRIKAPPEGGKANRELISYFSKYFKVPKNEIEIVSGETSRHKRVSLPLKLLNKIRNLNGGIK